MHFFERKNEFETLLSFFLIDAGMPPFSLNKFRDASKKKKKYLKLLSSTSVAIFKYNREYIKWIPSIQGGELNKNREEDEKDSMFYREMNLQWKSP